MSYPSSKIRSNHLLRWVPVLIVAVSTVAMISQSSFSAVGTQTHQADDVMTPSSAPDFTWRFTRFGWQNPRDWFRTPAEVDVGVIAQIDPILLSVNIVLAAFGALIWFADDQQIARLVGRPPKPIDRIDPF